MGLKEEYNQKKNGTYTKQEIVAGLKTILGAAGLVSTAITIGSFTLFTALPFLSGLGVPITAGTLTVACRSISNGWNQMKEQEKRNTIAALKWISRGINVFNLF